MYKKCGFTLHIVRKLSNFEVLYGVEAYIMIVRGLCDPLDGFFLVFRLLLQM